MKCLVLAVKCEITSYQYGTCSEFSWPASPLLHPAIYQNQFRSTGDWLPCFYWRSCFASQWCSLKAGTEIFHVFENSVNCHLTFLFLFSSKRKWEKRTKSNWQKFLHFALRWASSLNCLFKFKIHENYLNVFFSNYSFGM